tara:strand:- start:21 stop:752 length:732 start_codon:yes stop_codon:yes gene_type:complete
MKKNKNLLITGVSSGIGYEILESAIKKNFNVIGISRQNPKKIKNSKNFKYIKFDLNKFSDYDKIFNKIHSHFGKIDHFVHAAGVHDLVPSSLISEKSYDKILNINLKSPALISKYFSSSKIFNRPSSVVFISSIMGVVGASGQSLYSSSKGGVISLSKSLSLELARYKIRVNCVSPGVIKGKLFDEYLKNISSEKKIEVLNSHPLKIGTYRDVTEAVFYLLDEQKSSWITGHNLIIDGGYTAK